MVCGMIRKGGQRTTDKALQSPSADWGFDQPSLIQYTLHIATARIATSRHRHRWTVCEEDDYWLLDREVKAEEKRYSIERRRGYV